MPDKHFDRASYRTHETQAVNFFIHLNPPNN